MKKKTILNKLNDLGIIEGNKAIAKFLNLNMDEEAVVIFDHAFAYDQLRFHDLIGWIMPVVEQITKLKSLEKDNEYFMVEIKNRVEKTTIDEDNYISYWSVSIGVVGHYSHNLGVVAKAEEEVLIDALWKCVIEFIFYFNNEKK